MTREQHMNKTNGMNNNETIQPEDGTRLPVTARIAGPLWGELQRRIANARMRGEKGLTISDWVEEAIRQRIEREKEPS